MIASADKTSILRVNLSWYHDSVSMVFRRACPGWRLIHNSPRIVRQLGRPVHVFHPHGLIPRRHKWLAIDPRRLVFSGAQFEQRASDGFGPPSVSQMLVFGNRNCLFFGCSFEDHLVRTLLNVASRPHQGDPPLHLALLKRPDAVGNSRAWTAKMADRLSEIGVRCLFTEDYNSQKHFLRLLLQEGEERERVKKRRGVA